MGNESHARLTELAPSVKQAITQKLKAEGLTLASEGLTIDALGRIFFFGIMTQYAVDYLDTPVNPEDGTYDTGDKAVVRKRV